MISLDHYRLLGRSGLRVSPLALGTMTFGQEWGWGADAKEARRIFDLYIDRGGNFVDTAVNYTNGASERLLGEFLRDKRERVVLATKFTMARDPGNPNSGGNHRLNLLRSVEQSLRQEIGATASQVALAWTLANRAVTAPVMGARTLAQADDNLGALGVELSEEQRARLDAASAPQPVFPGRFVARPLVQQLIFGGASVTRRISKQTAGGFWK